MEKTERNMHIVKGTLCMNGKAGRFKDKTIAQ